ncbi:hypothetical protein OQA88_12565 [Cercophora sp. LCS_1]
MESTDKLVSRGDAVIQMSQPMTPAHLYDRLPLRTTDSIRVLELDPLPQKCRNEVSPAMKPPLTGQLRVVSLDLRPSFTALSYVWGDFAHPRDVAICNAGFPLEITPNCHDALLALRRKGPVTIWIDAICINQADNGEKRTQIPLMNDIYSPATTTHIWLCECDDKTNQGLDWIEKETRGCVID